MPAFLIKATNSLALPSQIGGSFASMLMSALSTPMPVRAEITCSTVWILTGPWTMVVARSTVLT